MKKSICPLVVVFLLSLLFTSQTAESQDLEQLDRYFATMAREWDVTGMSIGIVKNNQLVFTGNYGIKEVGRDEAPDKNTLYAIASNSKAFTSALIGMLVEEGKIDWDDKVQKYLPYFEMYDPWVSNEVTVRDLLCHRVGLGTFSGDVIWYKSELTAEEIIKRIKHLPPAFDFRAGYGYSNLMYVTAGELIKKVTGKSWSKNVQERILAPLGMERTMTTPKNLETKGNFATPHAREENQNIPIEWEDWETVGATGGIISSVEDMSKWIMLNLNHGIWKDDTLISKNTRNIVWTPHNNFVIDHTSPNDFNTHFLGYGLGWGLADFHGQLLVRHTGGYDGMISAVSLIPDENLGVVVLTNGMKSPIRAATYYALQTFLGIETKDWSEELLARYNRYQQEDARISKIKESRVTGTEPSLTLEKYSGTYTSDIYGDITIVLEDEVLHMRFEHTPALSATLTHWHYDVWQIRWNQKHAWFDFGTVKFDLDNNLEVTGMTFDVPNDDIFFHELKPLKTK